MSKTAQLWRYSWFPQGYPVETLKIDISNISKNENFSLLSHTFFKSTGFKAYSISSTGTKRYYKCHSEMKSDTDILFDGYDETLSKIANDSLYCKLKLVSDKVAKKDDFFIDCSFVVDILDPTMFNQELHQEANVVHKSLVLTDSLISNVGTFNEITTDLIKGLWGTLGQEISFTKTISVVGTKISETGVEVNNKEIKFGSSTHNISFDASSLIKVKVGDKKEGTLLRTPKLEDIPTYGIPVILADDKSKFSFTEYLRFDAGIKGIKTNNINLGDNTIFNENHIDIAKKYNNAFVTINNDNFMEYDKASGKCYMFNNLIVVDFKNKNVTINGVHITPEMFSNLKDMKKELKDRREKDKNN